MALELALDEKTGKGPEEWEPWMAMDGWESGRQMVGWLLVEGMDGKGSESIRWTFFVEVLDRQVWSHDDSCDEGRPEKASYLLVDLVRFTDFFNSGLFWDL